MDRETWSLGEISWNQPQLNSGQPSNLSDPHLDPTVVAQDTLKCSLRSVCKKHIFHPSLEGFHRAQPCLQPVGSAPLLVHGGFHCGWLVPVLLGITCETCWMDHVPSLPTLLVPCKPWLSPLMWRLFSCSIKDLPCGIFC